MSKILLLDGNSLVFRAFFAIPDDMATSAGFPTNAVYGFTSMLVNLIRDHQPQGMAVAFDRAEPTFRHEMVDEYKAGRAETPDSLFSQFDLVKQVLSALGIAVVEKPGFEADDVIATLAKRADRRGDDVIVVSGDRDTFQLVHDPHVRVLYNKRGVTDYELYDEAGIEARTGVRPAQYVVYAALRGDPSDNLPGVPGVGEKTAAKLVTTYGDLEGLYAHLDELTPKLRESLVANEAQARSNLEMMPLVEDVEIDLGENDSGLSLGRWSLDALREIFEKLEFKGLRRRVGEVIGLPELAADGAGSKAPGTARGQPEWVPRLAGPIEGAAAPSVADLASVVPVVPAGAEQVVELVGSLAKAAATVGLQVVWEGDPGRSAIAGCALVGVDGGGALAGAAWVSGRLVSSRSVATAMSGLLAGGARVVTHRAKEAMRSLAPKGIRIGSLAMDVAVAAYLLDPSGGDYRLEEVAKLYLPGYSRTGEVSGDGDADARSAGDAAAGCATALALEPVLRERLRSDGMLELYERVENPLVAVLAEMEITGVGVDADRLSEISSAMAAEAAALEREIQALAGEDFTVNSTKQLREILYTKLGLTPSRKTKTGYSTDAASLEKLRGQHPIVEKLLRYREVEKLRSTYGAGLLSEIDPADGRIHASFNQTVARTGRLSSDRPNLHNIPVRTDDGRRIREAFVPAEGSRLLIADYNQIELRVIAHLSGDPGLREAFSSHTDIHTATASRIFGVEPGAVSTAQRSKAKMVSYGLSYGMEAFGLSSRLGIGVDEASTILEAFFTSFPGVRSYMERSVAEARDRGYSITELGRRRPIPELQSGNRQLRMQAERQAMNAAVQGLAADIFKLALVKLHDGLVGVGASSRIVLQVHDEVIVEVPSGEEGMVEGLTRDALEHAYELSVPLEVEVSWGESWAAAKL